MRCRVPIALLIFLAAPLLAQTSAPDEGTLQLWLDSSSLRDVAWAAFYAGRDNRRELIPQLTRKLDDYQASLTIVSGRVSVEDAAIQAVADALIRLEAVLPARIVMHLYPRFPGLTVILLARATDPQDALMRIFETTEHRDLWLTAGNLLTRNPPTGFAKAVLDHLYITFTFRVVTPSTSLTEDHSGRGCVSDFVMKKDEQFRDWPPIREYQLQTSQPQNIFAPGNHPVGYIYWATSDYIDHSMDADCASTTNFDWRVGLLAQVVGDTLRNFSLRRDTQRVIRFRNVQAFENEVRTNIEEQQLAFREVVDRLRNSGSLSEKDASAATLKCRVDVRDERTMPDPPLPNVADRWCQPPNDLDLRAESQR